MAWIGSWARNIHWEEEMQEQLDMTLNVHRFTQPLAQLEQPTVLVQCHVQVQGLV